MSNKYHDFFISSAEGQAIMTKLNRLIDSQHKKAEENPDMARDYTQRACAIREVLLMIKTMTVDSKKKPRLLDE